MRKIFHLLSKEKNLILAIFILAFLLRLIYLQQAKYNYPFFYTPKMDAEIYDNWAREIAGGNWIGTEVFIFCPLYPYFLSLIYAIFGRNLYLARLIQMLFGSLTCVLTYLLGKKVFNRAVGFIAALFACGYGIFIFYDAELLSAFLGTFLALSAVLVIHWAHDGKDARRWLGAGFLAGLAALARPQILFFILLIPIWLVIIRRRQPVKETLLTCGAFALTVVLAIFPVTLRNYVLGDGFVLISAHGGHNFYIGNNPHADGTYRSIEGISDLPGKQIREAHRRAETILGRRLRFSEADHFWFALGLKFIREHPDQWVRLLGRKFFLFWNAEEPTATTQAPYHFARGFSTLLKLPLFSYGLISPLAVCGIFLAARQWRKAGLLYLFLISFLAFLLLFFIEARYRLPVVPVLMLFSGYTVHWCLQRAKEKAYLKLGMILGCLLPLVYFTNYAGGHLDRGKRAYAHLRVGALYGEKGRFKEAVRECRKALEYGPEYAAEAYLLLGIIHTDHGKYDEAVNYCREAIKVKPEFVEAHTLLGLIYTKTGRLDEAISQYRDALEINPDDLKTHVSLGKLYADRGQYDNAIAEYRAVIKLHPEYVPAYNDLGEMLFKKGEYAQAREYWEKALSLNPDFARARLNLENLNQRLEDRTQRPEGKTED